MTITAIDDGIVNSEFNWADIWFLVGVILGVLAAVLHHPKAGVASAFSGVLLALAVASVSLGLLLL
jgi:hypothetical protein